MFVENYAPYEYSKLNLAMSTYQPNSLHVIDSEAFRFYQRALFQRIQSTFKIKSIPQEWKGPTEDFLYYLLISYGFVCVSETATLGKYFSACTLSGFNLYWQPTHVIVQNPINPGTKLELGKEAELLKLTPDYRGLIDIVNKFAEPLALIDTSINTSLINSKIPYYLFTQSKSAAEALKLMIDNANSGNTAIVANSAIKTAPDGSDVIQQLKLFSANEYIIDKLLADHNVIIKNFDAEIGIPSVPYEKKERLVTDEANSRKLDSTARTRVWLDSLKSSCDLINAHFGLSLQPVLTTDEFEEKEGNANENNTDRNGELSK